MRICVMEVLLMRSKRKTLALEITPDLRVLLRVPLTCSQQRAEQFLEQHKDWLEKHYARQQQRAKRLALSREEMARLRQKAKEILPGRVEHFAKLTGLMPTGVGVTAAKTRFGSCSGKNRLNFSLYLMGYPPKVVDYVVLHEICHIKYKNHSKEFYQLIGQYMPEYKEYIKQLRK